MILFTKFHVNHYHYHIVLATNYTSCTYISVYLKSVFLYNNYICMALNLLLWFCYGAQLGFANHLQPNPFLTNADKFVCSVLPESPTKFVSYSPGMVHLY